MFVLGVWYDFPMKGSGLLSRFLYENNGAGLMMKIAVAESCTGGLLSSFFTKDAGASEFFTLGITSYSNQAKHDVLGISKGLLDTQGAVSAAVAEQMAQKVRVLGAADVGLSTTGIAGPDGGSNEKPVGTVFIAVSFEAKTVHRKLNLKGDRLDIQTQTVAEIIKLLNELMLEWDAE